MNSDLRLRPSRWRSGLFHKRRRHQQWGPLPELSRKVDGYPSDASKPDTNFYRMVLRVHDHTSSYHNSGIFKRPFQTTWPLSILHICVPGGWGGGTVIPCDLVTYQSWMGRKGQVPVSLGPVPHWGQSPSVFHSGGLVPFLTQCLDSVSALFYRGSNHRRFLCECISILQRHLRGSL